LRHILGAMTTNRFTGLLTGAFVTAFVQSSTATNGIFGRKRISFG
jgi:phosphate:Na+ symporter